MHNGKGRVKKSHQLSWCLLFSLGRLGHLICPSELLPTSCLTGNLPYQDFTFPVTAFIRWDERAGLRGMH
jgi:hypothetical protein